MRDDRSNRSHDDLSRVGEEIDDFTESPVSLRKFFNNSKKVLAS
jgi:hypothetical protein